MTTETRNSVLFAALFVGVTALFLWSMDARIFKGLAYQPNMPEKAAGVIIALMVVTLIVERASAVVNALVFGEEERQAEYERIQAANANASSGPAEAKLKKVLDKKARLRLLLGFVTGLFVSAAGVRTLQDLLVLTAADGQPPITVSPLLYSVDVVMTAALIAGGSASLAFLAAVLRDLAAPPPQPQPQPQAQPQPDPRPQPIDTVVGDQSVAASPARTMSVGPRLV